MLYLTRTLVTAVVVVQLAGVAHAQVPSPPPTNAALIAQVNALKMQISLMQSDYAILLTTCSAPPVPVQQHLNPAPASPLVLVTAAPSMPGAVQGGSEVGPLPNTFSPTPDNVFVCTARSMTALIKVVSAEHNGYFVDQFSNFKLRDNPDLARAAIADAASCEKGSYIGAMEKALQAEAAESARLRGLLKRIP